MTSLFPHISTILTDALRHPGDLCELGVRTGDTFVPMALAAHRAGRTCWGIDSFEGFAEPSERDRLPDGKIHYLKGGMNLNGVAGRRHVEERCKADGCNGSARVLKAWIPEDMPFTTLAGVQLCFTHIDLDHYGPTMASLDWAWHRTVHGGIVCCHDVFPPGHYQAECQASGAWWDWIKQHGLTCQLIEQSRHGFVIKGRA